MKYLTKPNYQLYLTLTIIALIYWFTKSPSILWIDSGTMIGASADLGIPNPPGFPFYMMSTHFFSQIFFFLTKLQSMQLFTMVFSIGLLLLVYKIIYLLIDRIMSQESRVKNKETMIHDSSFIIHLSALFGMISLAFSYQYWSQTGNTEAFIPSYFFVTLFAWLLLRVTKQSLFKTLALIAFLFGLAAGMNPTVAAFVPVVLFVMYRNRKFLNLKSLILLGSIFLITLTLVYSYLPIRASHWPFVNWGNPQTWDLFWGHLKGHGLDINEPGPYGSINGFTGSPIIFARSVSYWILNSLIQFTPFLVPFLLFGIYFVLKKNRFLLVFLMTVPIFDVIYSGIYLSGNQESWFILSWIFFSIFIGVGFSHLAESRIMSQELRIKKIIIHNSKFMILFSLCLLPLLIFFPILNRSSHYFSSDYAQNLYGPLEKNAILIGTGDFFNALSHYLHEADIFRPDVTPITANVFYVNRWYRDGLRHAAPQISISAKIDDIIQYRKYSEYNDSMNQFIEENIDSHPIYVTPLTLRASAVAATASGQLKLDETRFKFIPAGLVLKVVRAGSKEEPNLSLFDFKFKSPLGKAPTYLERNYKGAFGNILNDYTYGFEYLADWFANKNDDKQALEFYQKANALSTVPNAEVLAHLGEFYANRKDFNASYQYLAKAERLDINNPTIHFNLGLSYANLGMNAEAIQEFNSVIQLSGPDDPIIGEAGKIIKQLSAPDLNSTDKVDTTGWQDITDPKNNLKIKIPAGFKKGEPSSYGSILITDGNAGNLGLNIEILGTKLKEGQNIDDYLKDSPVKMLGQLLDMQQIKFEDYQGAVQVFSTPDGAASQRYILIKGQYLWQFKVYPGSSVKFAVFNNILNTFKTYE